MAEANKSVKLLLTLRNWLIGYYIVEYEQKGSDKAKYGDKLLHILSASLNIKGLSVTNLKPNTLFYIAYPQMSIAASKELHKIGMGIDQTPSDQLFVRNYMVQLPGKDELESFIKHELSNL